jgi:hypothetical protein
MDSRKGGEKRGRDAPSEGSEARERLCEERARRVHAQLLLFALKIDAQLVELALQLFCANAHEAKRW